MSDPKERLDICCRKSIELKGQDLFLKVGTTPRVRIGRNVISLPFPAFSEEEINQIIKAILRPAQMADLEKNKSVDFAFTLAGTEQRFRGNIFCQQGYYSMVLRTLWSKIPTMEELRIPPIFKKVALSRSGLILIAGVVASGKTTSINSMIEMMNQNVERHIITIEDPLEYLHLDKKCIINQREIGSDAIDFHSALKYVVRQSPDVVMVGEIRDAETFDFALSSAEVGRLVIGTVHAKTVVQIFDRVLGFYPPDQRDTILSHIYPNINCFAVQQLVFGKDGTSLLPACEIMIGNFTTRQLVKEKKFDKLPQAMRNSADEGMITMDDAILQLWRNDLITKETAMSVSERPQELENSMKGINLGQSKILGG